MLIVGIIFSVFGIAFFCWLLFTLAVYALPFFALCSQPHKANYVASKGMWRTHDTMLSTSKTCEQRATY